MFRSLAVVLCAVLELVAVPGHCRPAADGRAAGEIQVVLTGQTLVQSDIRRAGPRYLATAQLLSGDVVFTNFETTVHELGASLAEMDPVAGVHAPPESLDALKGLGFNLISVANNHIYDIGRGGLLATRKGLRQRGLAYSGIEIYRGKPIFYDLGNYMFQVNPQHIDLFGPLAGESAIATVRFRNRQLRSIVFHPIVLDPRPGGTGPQDEFARGLPAPAGTTQGDAILQRLAELSRELGTSLRVANGVAELMLQPER